jgi:hypothetical protein
MNVTEVKLTNALERETKLKTELQKEKDRNKKLEETLSKVTQHNIALSSELKGTGGNINLIG